MWSTIGHDRVLAALQRDLEEGRAAHAYLLSGPPRIGKGTLARELAQALNCAAAPDARPCGVCLQCERIAANRHADIELLTPRSPCEEREHDHSRDTSASLRICQVRRVEHDMTRAPYEGRTRVVIIDPADALTPEAANAFLKTLEEPPPNSALILVTADAESLLPTVRSRCRSFTLGPVPADALRKALVERWGASDEEAERLARLAEGRTGWARNALDDEGIVMERLALIDRAESLAVAPRDERLAYAEEQSTRWPAHRQEIREELEIWQAWWRDVLVVRAGRPDLAVHQERADALRVAAEKFTPVAIIDVIESIRRTVQYLDENANARLSLEVLMLSITPARPAGAALTAQAAQ